MARPLKDGVDYFPKDVDFYIDDKVRLLRSDFGAKGMYLLDYLLCEIYRSKGYYLAWNKDKCALVSEGAGCGCTPNVVNEVVSGCLQRSIFDNGVFEKFGILTSAGIQRRFIRMLEKRDDYKIINEYFLLDIDNPKDVPAGIRNKLTFENVFGGNNSVFGGKNSVKDTDNPKSKIEENKIDYIKENKIIIHTNEHTEESIKRMKKFAQENGMECIVI